MRLKPIVFTVDQVHLISRGATTPFEVKHSVKLGTSSGQEGDSEVYTNPELLIEEDPGKRNFSFSEKLQILLRTKINSENLIANIFEDKYSSIVKDCRYNKTIIIFTLIIFICTAKLTDPVDIVIVRLKQWLVDQDPSKLPKTRDKLKTSIRPMCRVKYDRSIKKTPLLIFTYIPF